MPIDPASISWDQGSGITWDDEKPKARSAMQRFGEGLADQVHGGAQLLENAVRAISPAAVDRINALNNQLAQLGIVAKLPAGGVDQQVREREAALKTDGMDWARLAGNVLSPVNAIGGAAGAGQTLLGRMAVGAGLGATTAAMMPNAGGAEDKLKQMAVGAAGGGITPAIIAGASRIVSPKASTNPDLALLKAEGIKPTIGQTLGGRWNATEEKLQSLPIMGDAISNARRKALEGFDAAAINRAAGKVGAQVDDIGQSGVKSAGDAISAAYDDALSSLKVVKFDGKFGTDLAQLRGMAKGLTADMERKFEKTVRDVLAGRTFQAGGMTAETMKKVDSELGQISSRYARSSVASEQELSDAVKKLQALLREQVARNSPEAAQAVRAADAGWANLVRVEGAAKAAKNNGGVFTPAQLNAAIQQADTSVRRRAVSRGTALMQDLGSAGQNVLGNKVPNSGTFDRAIMDVGALASYVIDPMIPGALIGGAALYSQPAQGLLRALVSGRPESAQAISALLNQASPMLAPAGGLLALENMK